MKSTFLTLIALSTIGFAQAQNQTAAVTVPDDLKALVQQANTNYPALKQQQQQIQAGEVRVDIARTAMRPSAALNGTYTYVTPVPQFAIPLNGQEVVAKLAPNNNINANVSVGQTIYDFGRTDAAIKQAADNVQILRRNFELTQQTLGYQVAAAYYGIGYLQQGIIVQDSVIKTAAANVRLLASRLQNGDALEYDVLTQQVRLKATKSISTDGLFILTSLAFCYSRLGSVVCSTCWNGVKPTTGLTATRFFICRSLRPYHCHSLFGGNYGGPKSPLSI